MFDFPLQRDNLYKQVADRIEELVVSQSVRPGDKLPGERELAEQMGVSRTVVREAIRVLSVRGLVETKSGCGTYVRELKLSDVSTPISLFLKLQQGQNSIRDVYETRYMIEVAVAGLAAERADAQDIARIQETIEQMSSLDKDVADQFVQLDLDFHLALAQATHNILLGLLLQPITDLWYDVIRISYQVPDAIKDALFYHSSILEQVKQHDVDGAKQAMSEHIRHSQHMVESVHSDSNNP